MRRHALAILVWAAAGCSTRARFEHRAARDVAPCVPAAAIVDVRAPAPVEGAVPIRVGAGDVLVDVTVSDTLGESMRTAIQRALTARGYRVLTPTREHPADPHAFAITGSITPPVGRLVVTEHATGQEVRVFAFEIHADDFILPAALPGAVADAVLDRQRPPPTGPTGRELACIIEPLDCHGLANRTTRIRMRDRPLDLQAGTVTWRDGDVAVRMPLPAIVDRIGPGAARRLTAAVTRADGALAIEPRTSWSTRAIVADLIEHGEAQVYRCGRPPSPTLDVDVIEDPDVNGGASIDAFYDAEGLVFFVEGRRAVVY